jgi:hypothetical protein
MSWRKSFRARRVVLALGVAGAAALAGASACGTADSPVTAAPDAAADAPVERVAHPPVDDDADAPVTGPSLLSETGLYADFASRTVAAELFPFAPRYEFWADGAEKSRWLYLPPGTQIDTARIDHWVFPVGTKAFKEFRYGGKPVETRLLMKVREGRGNGVWWEAAYVWRDDGSDAVATLAGVVGALGTEHKVPSQIDCRNCHGDVSDVLIGVSAIQLSDPSTQTLAALDAAGKLSTSPPANIDVPGTGVVKDSLAYLHANCGHCHNSEAVRLATQSKMRLRLLVGQPLEQTGAFTTTVGTVMKHTLGGGVTDVVVKGDPDRSGLALRLGRRDLYGMPPAGTQQVDDAGVALIRQWIIEWP